MKKTLLLTFVLLFTGTIFAESAVNLDNQDDKDNTECKKNVTYFKIHAKGNNFQDAYVFWKKAYEECPSFTKDIYITGPKILRWKIENATTPEEKKKYEDELMGMYDSRIKYFGKDPKYGVDYILASKVEDYLSIKGKDADYLLIYDWLKDIVNEKKSSTDYMALNYFIFASMNKMLRDESHKEQYINDYLAVSSYYEEGINKAEESDNEQMIKLYSDLKGAADSQFAASGAASCEMLEKIYDAKVDEKQNDKDFLDTVINLLRKVNCQESPLYFKASEYAYKIEPSAEAALGLAKRALLNKNTARANQLFEEAAELSTTSDQRGDIYYNMALLAYEQGQYSRVRTFANKAMAEKSGFGAPMILIANAYAATANSIFPGDPIKTRIVYCLVVDKLERAKAIDPSCAAEANRLIGRYRPHYPSKEDVFMHPDLTAGQSITIGGWIGETTTIRTSN